MTTTTIKINEKSKKGKAFLEFARTFFTNEKDVVVTESKDETVQVEDGAYNSEFVEKVLKAAQSKNRTKVSAENVFGQDK